MAVDWAIPNPKISRIVCEDEVSRLVVTNDHVICQHWIQPEISVFSRVSLELEKILEGHEYGGQCLETNMSGLLFSASLDRTLISWDIEAGVMVDRVSDHADYVQCIGYNAPWVATGGQGDKKIYVYMVDSLGKLKNKYKLCGHTGWVKRIAILGNTLVSGSLDSTIRIWDLWTGHQSRSLPVVSPVMSLSLVNLNLALFGGKEGEVSFLDLNTGKSTTVVPLAKYGMDRYRRVMKFHQGSVDALMILEEQNLVLTGGEDRHVILWRITKSEEHIRLSEIKEIDTIREHSEYINCIRVFENSIFSSSGDVNVLIHEYPWEEGKPPDVSIIQPKPEKEKAQPAVDFEAFMSLVGESKKAANKEMDAFLVQEDIKAALIINSEESCTEEAEDLSSADANEAEEGTDTSRSETSASSLSRQNKPRKRKRWVINKNLVEIHEEIGRGKFGIAFRGTYKNITVVVKVTNPLAEEEFSTMEDGIIKEVGRFCRFKHPSLVKYYGVVANKDDLNFWIVTEFLTGHTLTKLIEEPEVKSLYNLRRRDRLEISEYLASALDYLHNNNIIHGHLTAWNIFISSTEGGRKLPKITDFGLLDLMSPATTSLIRCERSNSSSEENGAPTCDDTRTHLFCPPEILLKQQIWDNKSDVWCLGAILLEFNLESYMWDSHCIEKAKINYVDGVDKQEPIRFGLKIRWSSFEFLWDCLNYKPEHRPRAADLADGFQLIICQNTKTIREIPLTDDMIFWLSKQPQLLASWQSLAIRLGVISIVPIVRDCVTISGDRVSVILEAWKVKYSDSANLSRLIQAIQSLQLQPVVDGFYREFQISKVKRIRTKLQ